MGEAIRSIADSQQLKLRELERRIRSLETEKRTRRLLPVQEYTYTESQPRTYPLIGATGVVTEDTTKRRLDPGDVTKIVEPTYADAGMGFLLGQAGYWLVIVSATFPGTAAGLGVRTVGISGGPSGTAPGSTLSTVARVVTIERWEGPAENTTHIRRLVSVGGTGGETCTGIVARTECIRLCGLNGEWNDSQFIGDNIFV